MRATGHLQPGSPHAITSNHAAPGPAPPPTEQHHTPPPTSSHASATPPEPPPQQSQQQPQPQPQQQQQQEQAHGHTPDSGQLADLQHALAKCKQRTGNSAVLNLNGRTFKGQLKGPLVIASDITLVNGALQLPPHTQLLIRGAQGVTLKDLIIRGTTQQGLTVVICEGSSVTMQGCTVEGAEAVGVEGGSSLKATDCIMRSSSGSGLRVLAGGRAALDRCECEGCSIRDEIIVEGCTVSGQGSSLTAKGCTFHCQEGTASGLGIYGAAKAVLHGCVSSQNSNKGIHVSGNQSSLIACDCSVCCNSGVNIQVFWGASAVLNGCKIDSGKEDGITVEGLGSTCTFLRATSCSVSRNGVSGVLVNSGARAQLSACVIEANEVSGLSVSGNGTAASATECLINQTVQHNVCAMSGAHLDLHGCEVNHSKGGNGFLAFGEGTQLVCDGGTTAYGNNGHNLFVCLSAVAELTADCVVGQAVQQ